MQGLVVTLTGALAWLSVWQQKSHRLPHLVKIALSIYVACCALSLIGHFTQVNILGGPLMRLGSLEMIACVGIGVCLRQIPKLQLVQWLYASLAALGIISMPYSLWQAHHLVRIGGLVHQPDFLAVLLGAGLLLGLELWPAVSRRWRYALAISQIYLLVTIFMTQTRAVILLLFVVLFVRLMLHASLGKRTLIGAVVLLTVLIVGLGAMRHATDGRLTDSTFASQSLTYRLALQRYGLKAVLHKPLLGYGAYGIPVALACPTLHDAALQKTCQSHYYFDSSHNIYMDRFLEIGWLGGLSFLFLVVGLLWYGFKQGRQTPIFAYCGLLIALYYLTNVTSLEVELLLWIVLMRCLPPVKKHAKLAP